MRAVALYIFLLLCASSFRAQNTGSDFKEKFERSNLKEKVKLTASLSSGELKKYYPEIKDTLESIKKLIYFKSQSKEGKLLFDVIDANLAIGEKNYAKAIFLAENSLRNHATSVNDSLLCLSILKNTFVRVRNFIKAYEVNTKMEVLWPRKADSLELNYGISKAGLYASLGFLNEAIKARRAEFKQKNSLHDTDALASYYNDIGVYFNRQKKSDSAAVYFLRVQELISNKKFPEEKRKHYEFIKALSKGNLGLSYYNKGEVNKAIPLLKEDIYYSLKYDRQESAFNSYLLMVECYLSLKDIRTARLYLDSSERLLSNHLHDLTPRLNLLYLQSKFHQASGDYKISNDYFEKYFSLRDSVSLIEKEQNLVNTEVAFKIEQKEQELTEKNRMLEQKKLNEARQKTFRAYTIAGILLLLAIIVILILNNNYSKNREKQLYITNEKINQQNSQIEQSLREKEVLIKEIHHRVKNNLQIITSMLSLQIGKEEGTHSESILREAKQRIDSIALTHQMLYQNEDLSSIFLCDYLEKLVRQIEYSLPPTGIKLVTDFKDSRKKINIDHAIPLGLLINELLTNAYKHAFPGKDSGLVTVSLSESSNEVILKVTDNGIGLPDNYRNNDRKSMGMDLVHILAEQLDAVLITDIKMGTSFTLVIPKNKLFS